MAGGETITQEMPSQKTTASGSKNRILYIGVSILIIIIIVVAISTYLGMSKTNSPSQNPYLNSTTTTVSSSITNKSTIPHATNSSNIRTQNSTNNESARTLLQNDLSRANSLQNITLFYSLSSFSFGNNTTASYYKSGNNSESVLESPYNLPVVLTTYYNESGMNIECQTLHHLLSPPDIGCSQLSNFVTQGSFSPFNLEESIFTISGNPALLNNVSVSYLGVNTIGGSACDDFEIEFEPNSTAGGVMLSQAVGLAEGFGTPLSNIPITINECVDKKYGFGDYYRLTLTYIPILQQLNVTGSPLVIALKNFSIGNVNQSVFVIPQEFKLADSLGFTGIFGTAICTQNSISVNLLAFRNIINPTVEFNITGSNKQGFNDTTNTFYNTTNYKPYSYIINDSVNETFEQFNNYTIGVSAKLNLNEFNNAQICVAGECESALC